MNPDNIPDTHVNAPADTPTNTPTARLRARLRAARRQLSAAERDHGALRLRARLYTWLALRRDAARASGQAAPQVIAAYWPLADEADLRPLLTQWVAAGLTVVLPVVVQKHAPLAFRVWTPDAVMAAGAYGIAEPHGTPEATPDVVLVPTLGYTDAAYRLGYGGGYYDRTLAALRPLPQPLSRARERGGAALFPLPQAGEGAPKARERVPVSIGVAWTCGRIADTDGWQPAPHDVQLDAVLTPDAWHPAAPV